MKPMQGNFNFREKLEDPKYENYALLSITGHKNKLDDYAITRGLLEYSRPVPGGPFEGYK